MNTVQNKPCLTVLSSDNKAMLGPVTTDEAINLIRKTTEYHEVFVTQKENVGLIYAITKENGGAMPTLLAKLTNDNNQLHLKLLTVTTAIMTSAALNMGLGKLIIWAN